MTTHSPMQKEPNNTHQPNMKQICEICGDLGIQEAIITCYQCKNVGVHQYCVMGYWEDAPVDWCCEECDIRKGVIFSPRGLENERFKESKLHASTKICQSTVQPKKHNKFPRRQHINWEKEVRTGKTRYLPVEEALGLSSRIKKYGSPPTNTVPSRVVSTKSRNFSKPKGPGASTILEHRTPNVVNESQMMNSPTTHPCDSALVPSWKSGRYIDLVEFMHNKDLVMRTLINDVELFILASTTLCSDSQRWNNEHFLWGLFYRMRQDTDKCAEGGSK